MQIIINFTVFILVTLNYAIFGILSHHPNLFYINSDDQRDLLPSCNQLENRYESIPTIVEALSSELDPQITVFVLAFNEAATIEQKLRARLHPVLREPGNRRRRRRVDR